MINSGFFQYAIDNIQFYAENSNNHQLTWGVLGSAILGISQYFTFLQDYQGDPVGQVRFRIMDGDNEVGRGFFGTGPSSGGS